MKMHVNITGKACAFMAALLTRSALLELAIRKQCISPHFPVPTLWIQLTTDAVARVIVNLHTA